MVVPGNPCNVTQPQAACCPTCSHQTAHCLTCSMTPCSHCAVLFSAQFSTPQHQAGHCTELRRTKGHRSIRSLVCPNWASSWLLLTLRCNTP
eukprot:1154778-Pelagomonas_calceolata.AAC.7